MRAIVIRALLLLAVTVVVMSGARSFMPADSAQPLGSVTCLGFGFLVLVALQVGTIAERLKVPRLTGYFLAGFVCGPEVSGLMSRTMVDNLRAVGGVAVGLIALMAGCEVNVALLKKRLRSILAISGIAMPVTSLVLAIAVLTLSPFLPFLRTLSLVQRAVAATMMGIVLSTTSPSAAVGILSETASAGPISETVLGTVVLFDVSVVIVFAIVHSLAGPILGADTTSLDPARAALVSVVGSMGAGLCVAGALALYLRRVGSRVGLFVLGLVLVAARVGSLMHLDVLVICLTAGLAVENVYGVSAESVREAIAPAALPVFAVFFSDSGARLHVHDVATLWPFAVGLAVLRGGSLIWGVHTGARIGGAEAPVRQWMPYGVLSQVGMSAGLAVTLERLFPTWGVGARPLILAVVTINQIVGPILLRQVLVRSGEAGAKRSSQAA